MSSRGFQFLHRREANEYLPFQRVRDAKALSQKELADLLLKEAVRRAQLISSGKSFWTDDSGTYFNRETKRPYKPHHKDEVRFVYTDSPTNVAVFGSEGSGKSVAGIIKTLERLRRGMSGAMACISPYARINDIPIGDYSSPSLVPTLYGNQWATSSYQKGRADLFRVATQSGASVEVTSAHRFLTPAGWHQLSDLRVGDVICVGGNESVDWRFQKQPDFLDYYFADFRLHGEYANLMEQYAQDKSLLPALLALFCVPSCDLRDHACIANSSFPPYVEYSKIQSITFQRYGEFYDITVPLVGHYLAEGIYHHNSPDLPHLKKSLWPEFQRWCAWDSVIPEHRYMQQFGWSPREPMIMGFLSGATLQVGGLDNPIAWEGSNISFAYIDEARRLKESLGMKTLKGRIRIAGARGEPPQIYFTTTKPRSTEHWLYTYFGDIQMDEDGNPDDPFLDFKEDSSVINLHVRDNVENLSEGFISQRAQGLDPEEVELLIENQWVDLNEQESYLPSIALWDSCKTQIEPLDSRTPVVLALDAAEISDTFAAVACSWHPTEKQNITCVRYCRVWNPNGKLLEFEKIEKEIEDFIKSHRVVILVYDRALISQMCRRLSRFVWAREFSQAGDRLVADKLLHDAIMARTIMHSGNDQILRKHLMNADKKTDPEGRKMRIVKRSQNLKIDAAVALSMAHDYAKRPKINLGI